LSQEKPHFTFPDEVPIYGHVAMNPNLCPDAKIFFGVLSVLSAATNRVYGSNKQFAKLMNKDERTIQRYFEDFENFNLLDRDIKNVLVSESKEVEEKKFNWVVERDLFINPNPHQEFLDTYEILYNQGYFFPRLIVIPKEIAQNKKIKGKAKLLYGFLKSRSYYDGYTKDLDDKIAKFLGVSVRAVQALLKCLEKFKLISRETRKTFTKIKDKMGNPVKDENGKIKYEVKTTRKTYVHRICSNISCQGDKTCVEEKAVQIILPTTTKTCVYDHDKMCVHDHDKMCVYNIKTNEKELTNQKTPPKAQKVSKAKAPDSGFVGFSEKQKTIENLKLSVSQKRTILKHSKSMDLEFFKSQVAKFADYAKSNHVTNHFGLLRSVLGLDGKPAWEDAKPKDQGSIEEQNREAAIEKLGVYDGKPIKGLSFEILNSHCQFTNGTFAQIFEFKNYDFVPRINEFLERLGLNVCFG